MGPSGSSVTPYSAWISAVLGGKEMGADSSGVAAFSGDPKAWYLKPGDVMECEIENVGILRNPVISWQEAYGQKPAALATQEALK